MLLHCLNAPSSPPTPDNPSPLSTSHSAPSTLSPLAPPPPPDPTRPLPRSCFQPTPLTHVLLGSVPLHAMLNHRGCDLLCVLIICDR